MRVLAVDLGSKRIGTAVSDATGTLASPHEVIERSGTPARDHQALARVAAETGAELVVVGLPLSLDGSIGPAARLVLDEVALVEQCMPIPVMTFDERLTTVTAHSLLADGGLSSKKRRSVIDKAAAAVLLQAWLESPERRKIDHEGRSGSWAPRAAEPPVA